MRSNNTDAGADAPGGVKTYRQFSDDFVESKNQDIRLPDEKLNKIHRNVFYRIGAQIFYGIAILFTFFYVRFTLHMKVVNGKAVKSCKKTGYFIYGNHTQPFGDVFIPVRLVSPKRVRIVISKANLGIPVLGKMLPFIGGIPIPDTAAGMKNFIRTLRFYTEKKACIVIYPEAHVWPYCSFVRPYPDSAFGYPVLFGLPAFCSTVTYQKRKHGTKPRVTVYLDGPFYPPAGVGKKEAQKKLHDEIFTCMQRRSKNSTYAYVKYLKES